MSYSHFVIAHQLQAAKQRFSSVADKAAKGDPQLVTKHGKPFVVIVKAADWYDKKGSEKPLWEVLRSCPTDLSELELSRSKDIPRDIKL